MEIKRYWKRDSNNALVMNSGNIVVDYLNKKKLIEAIDEINRLFKPDVSLIDEILTKSKLPEDFINKVKKENLLTVDSEQGVFALSDALFAKGTGIMSGDEPVLTGISLSRMPNTGIQRLTQKLIDKTVQDGFMTLSKGKVIFHTVDGDVAFNIVRVPGYYCCFTNKQLGDQKEARKYIEANFKGKASPCKNNPAGYRKDNFYTCELIAEGEG